MIKSNVYIAEILETWSTKLNRSNFSTTSPNKGFYDTDQPENHREEREEGKGARARGKKKTSNRSLVFIL